MKRRKPSRWRAVASWDVPGLRRVVVARCYRRTREGLQRFIDEHEGHGYTVTVWEVKPIPEVEELIAAATAPSLSVPSAP